VDAAEQPIADAEVWVARKGRLPFTKGKDHLLGATGPDGRAMIDTAGLVSPQEVVVGKAGYLSQRCSIEASRTVLLHLNDSECLRVICVEHYTARPLEGVWFCASTRGFDGLAEEDLEQTSLIDGCPAPEDEHPVSVGRSLADGTVFLRGLPKCNPSLWVDLPGYALVDGPGMTPPDNERVACPGRVYKYEFAAFFACGLLVRGDEIVSISGNVDGKILISQDGSIQKTTDLLKKAYPDAMIYVLPKRDPTKPLTTTLTVELAHKGARKVELEFQTISAFLEAGPTVLDASLLPSGASPASRVAFEIRNPDGTPLPGLRFFLERDREIVKRIVSGSETLLVPGTYSIAAQDPTVGNSLPPESQNLQCRESPDGVQNWSVILTRNLYKVSLRSSASESDDGIVGRSIRLASASGGRMDVLLEKDGSTEVLLPEGRFRVLVVSDGVEAEVASFAVGPAEDSVVQLPAR
jgi:hypothetical protein